MKKSIALLSIVLFIAGCSTHVILPFPSAPPQLMEPPERLNLLTKPDPQLSDILENTAENAKKYYQLRDKYLAWQMWYLEQSQLQEAKRKEKKSRFFNLWN
jgi:hypothetical protein